MILFTFKSPNGDRVVNIAPLANNRTCLTCTDSRGNITRTYDRPLRHYVNRVAERGYKLIDCMEYKELRDALRSEQKYHFSPELGAAIYAQLCA